MHLRTLDWAIVAVSLGITFLPAIFLARRAGKNTTEFFAAGRMAPWWLIGISLVATTFSTDTPNLVTNLVRTGGVAANWAWWAFLLTGMATVFFYARLWRRSGVLTDLEFYELRYSGKPAAIVRGFRSIYLGFFFNIMIISSVNLAASKIASVLFGLPELTTLVFAGAIVIVFAATAGLWGVMVTDMIQFIITMSSAIAAAVYALRTPQVMRLGGLHGLIAHFQGNHSSLLALLPDFSNWSVAAGLFVIPVTIQWWSVWYPGSEPGGGSYVAQRMLSARRESDSLWGTMLFQAAHYALRPWPWIVVALASIVVYPHVSDIHRAFPGVAQNQLGDDIAYPAMLVFLPAGWAGFMVAGLFAAYRSTLESHLNWGSSYLVHDFYRRFLNPDAGERHYVLAGRLVTALIMICAVAFTFELTTAKDTFNLILDVGAGTGLVYLLRWFWWRINAWTEIAAMAGSFLISLGFFFYHRAGGNVDTNMQLIFTVAVTTVVWLIVTFVTAPTDETQLVRFYEKVRPAGAGWRRIREHSGLPPSPDSLPNSLLGWVLGLCTVYSALFGTGSYIYGNIVQGIVFTVIFIVSIVWLVALSGRMWSAPVSAAGVGI
ncbi:MAG TPA: sodium:solute symporter family protein [Candidatus Baltobacteraceae bacterium]|jgi:Na+/proline symporter|nr:sodium:solute symporter family protein [Candidatus Baltobacteraceae bacterium]